MYACPYTIWSIVEGNALKCFSFICIAKILSVLIVNWLHNDMFIICAVFVEGTKFNN